MGTHPHATTTPCNSVTCQAEDSASGAALSQPQEDRKHAETATKDPYIELRAEEDTDDELTDLDEDIPSDSGDGVNSSAKESSDEDDQYTDDDLSDVQEPPNLPENANTDNSSNSSVLYKCSTCGASSNRKSIMKIHVNIHDPNRYIYVCRCMKFFATPGSHSTHCKRAHSGRKHMPERMRKRRYLEERPSMSSEMEKRYGKKVDDAAKIEIANE